MAHIKVWGCEAFVRRDTHDKLEPRSERCIFIGYPQKSFGYLFYRPNDNVVFVARRGVFQERELRSLGDSGRQIDLEEIQEPSDEGTSTTGAQPEEETPIEPIDESLPLRRSERVRVQPQFYRFHITTKGDTYISDGTLINLDEPNSYKEAMAGPESAKW